jgi:hypothetical protein
MAMYSLWKSEANEHFSERANKVVGNESYKQVSQHDKLADAQAAFVKALGTSKPGTKIKLIGTVPHPVEETFTASEKQDLLKRIEELTAKLAS